MTQKSRADILWTLAAERRSAHAGELPLSGKTDLIASKYLNLPDTFDRNELIALVPHMRAFA